MLRQEVVRAAWAAGSAFPVDISMGRAADDASFVGVVVGDREQGCSPEEQVRS